MYTVKKCTCGAFMVAGIEKTLVGDKVIYSCPKCGVVQWAERDQAEECRINFYATYRRPSGTVSHKIDQGSISDPGEAFKYAFLTAIRDVEKEGQLVKVEAIFPDDLPGGAS